MLIKDFISHNLQGKSVFISGGTGFFGKNILNYLQINKIQPAKITILTRNVQKFRGQYPELAQVSYLDYLEDDILNLKYSGIDYDYIIHAATSVVDKIPAKQLFNEIIDGTKNILEFAKSANVKSFINISSGAIYGEITTCTPVIEEFANRPKIESESSSYGLGKIAAEHYSYLYANEHMKVTSLRCFCFGGEYLDMEHYALGYFIKQATKNEDIVVRASGSIYRSYLSTLDLAQSILYTMIKAKTRESEYEVYNVGSDEAITISDLAKTICQILGSKSQVSCPNLHNTQISYYVPSIDKIRKTGLAIDSRLEDIVLNVQKYYLASNK